MQNLRAKLKAERRAVKKREEPETKDEKIAGLRRKQFTLGSEIFACQRSSMWKCAESDDMAGLRSFRKGLHPMDVDARNTWGNTCLILASERGFVDMVEVLLEDGADVFATNKKGQTACHAAAAHGQPKVVELLARKAPEVVVARDHTGASPAHYAAQADDPACLAALGSALEGTMHNGMTPAHGAALFDSPNALKFLYENGCDLDLPDSSGETCAHKAARVQALNALDFLRSVGLGSSMMLRQNFDGDTPDDLAHDRLNAWPGA